MQTHFLSKTLSKIGNSIRKIYSSISFPTFYKSTFLAGYLVVCIFILLPGIDYKAWYPKILNRFDYELSQDFSDHKALTISVNRKENISSTIDAISDRLDELKVRQTRIESDELEITFHLPSALSDQTIEYLVGKGEIEIMKRKDDAPTDYSAASLYDPNNYEETDIDLGKVRNARIIEFGEGYTSIEINTSQPDAWNSLSSSVSASSLGIFVDGQVYLGQIVPEGESTLKPRLIIFSQEDIVYIIASELRSQNLADTKDFSIGTTGPIYDINFSILLFVVVLLTITSGLVYRYYIRKDSLNSIAQISLIIAGVLTITKALPITWGIPELLSLSIVLITLTTASKKTLIYTSVSLVVLGILINQSMTNPFYSSSKLIYVSGICSLLIYLILFFAGIYEEK